MVQMSLFDVIESKSVSVPTAVQAVSPPQDCAARIAWESKRGEFAYWSPEAEARWRALAGSRPSLPGVMGVSVVKIRPNSRAPGVWDEPYTWEKMLECGRSYMVGASVPMDQFVKSHQSPLTAWQKLAYAWALENPLWRLCVNTPGREWEICTEGEYVCIALPHHDAGGERHYVTRNGRSKVLVNVD